MPKRQIFGSLIILVVLSFICMMIYDEFKDVKNERETKLIVEKGNSGLKLYYIDSTNRNYYLYGLDKITVDYGDRKLELNKALEARQITIAEIVSLIGNKNELPYWDGGSVKINNDNLALLQCHTPSGNLDYYFGPSDMEYKPGFCEDEPYICLFTKTYLVLDVSDSNDDNYIYLTLKMFQGEEVVTVKVKKNLIGNSILEDQYYEFQFASKGNSSNENIEAIFDSHELISITVTEKEGFEQINESVCE